MIAEMLATELSQPDGGCTTIVRFNYENLEPISWNTQCGSYSEMRLDEDAARMLSTCCSDGMRLGPAEEDMFVFHSPADEDGGGVSVISNHLAQRSFEATLVVDGSGEISHPQEWQMPDRLGSGCAATAPTGTGFDLTMDGAELDMARLDMVLSALADTALPLAIEQSGGMLKRTLTLAYPHTADDPAMTEYVVIVESGV